MAKQVKIDIVARDKTKRAIESSKKGLGGLKTFALAASAALASIGAGRVVSNLVNVGKSVESLQIRFKFLFGSAEEGARAFDTLSQFASRVPFSLEDIAAASGNLAVVAKDANELNKILEITGNVAGATGLDFQTTASQIQRAFAGGIASADIFREKGVRDMLGFSAGAKISVEETREAFEKVFAGNGEFAKTTEALAGTLEGTLSMINDKFFQFQLSINKAFFSELKTQFGDLNEFLAENEQSILKFGENVGKGLATSLKEAVESAQLIKASFDLVDRTLEDVTGSNDGLIKSFVLSTPLLREIFLGTQLIVEKNQEWTETLNNINPRLTDFNKLMDDTKQKIRLAGLDTEELQIKTEDLSDTYEFLAQKNTMSKPYQDLTASVDDAISSVEALTFAQQKVTKGFEDQKASSREAHQVEKEGLKSRKEGLAETGQALEKFAAEGAKRSKKMFRLQQAVQIGEAIMNTYAGATKALATLPPPFSFAVAGLTVATGLAQVANIRSQQPPAMFGGSRQQGTPFLVGERGPELFTPATAGTVTPNHQLPSGGNVVNFNITTVDAQSFGALLDTRRGQIVNMINTALNNKGQAALV